MKFLVDENLPPKLAVWITSKGHDAIHIRELGLLGQTRPSWPARASTVALS